MQTLFSIILYLVILYSKVSCKIYKICTDPNFPLYRVLRYVGIIALATAVYRGSPFMCSFVSVNSVKPENRLPIGLFTLLQDP